MLFQTIVSVNLLSIYRAVIIIWYTGKREGDKVDPNEKPQPRAEHGDKPYQARNSGLV